MEDIFLFNSWKHSSSLVVHLHGVFFFIRSVKGADEQVKLWICTKTGVHVVPDKQNFALCTRCILALTIYVMALHIRQQLLWSWAD